MIPFAQTDILNSHQKGAELIVFEPWLTLLATGTQVSVIFCNITNMNIFHFRKYL